MRQIVVNAADGCDVTVMDEHQLQREIERYCAGHFRLLYLRGLGIGILLTLLAITAGGLAWHLTTL